LQWRTGCGDSSELSITTDLHIDARPTRGFNTNGVRALLDEHVSGRHDFSARSGNFTYLAAWADLFPAVSAVTGRKGEW
jgi:hypothetical protein